MRFVVFIRAKCAEGANFFSFLLYFEDLLEKNQKQNAVLEHKNTVLFAAGGGEKNGFWEILNRGF